MKKAIFVLLVILFLLTISCESIDQSVPAQKGGLTKIDIDDVSSIPKAYGKLVGVTTHAMYEGWAQLWFEDENQTIRMVRVQFHTNRFHEKVLVIPRQ